MRLDDVARLVGGNTPARKNPAYFTHGTVPWVKTGDLTNGDVSSTEELITPAAIDETGLTVHPPGTVLVAMYGGLKQIGRTGLLRVTAATNQAITAIYCDEAALLPQFLLELLNAEVGYWRRLAGSSRKDPNITRADVAAFPLRLPPLERQSEIAARLAKISKASSLIERLIELTYSRKRGLMQQLLTGRRSLKGTARAMWTPRALSDLMSESRQLGASGASARKLTVKLYGRGVVAKSDLRPGSGQTQYFSRSRGQFIYSKLDFLNGAFGIIPDHLDGYESTLDLPAFDVSTSIDARWLLRLFSWSGFYRTHLRLANGGRKARRVNPAQLLAQEIDVPPIDEQRAVADLFDALDREIALLERQRELLDLQRRAVTDKLLSGEVRVPVTAAEVRA